MELRLQDGTVAHGTPQELHEFLHVTTMTSKDEEEEELFAPSTNLINAAHFYHTHFGFQREAPGLTYYDSASKGPVLIQGMHTLHIKNAILKMGREELPYPQKEFIALVNELVKRVYDACEAANIANGE